MAEVNSMNITFGPPGQVKIRKKPVHTPMSPTISKDMLRTRIDLESVTLCLARENLWELANYSEIKEFSWGRHHGIINQGRLLFETEVWEILERRSSPDPERAALCTISSVPQEDLDSHDKNSVPFGSQDRVESEAL
jgi:hypothetical protein